MSFTAKHLATDLKPIVQTWFPIIDCNDFCDVMRIDDAYTACRIRHAVINAAFRVNHELQSLKKAYADTFESFITCPILDDESQRETLYKTAIYHSAKASLIKEYADYDYTNQGNAEAESLAQEKNIKHHTKTSRDAVQRLLGQSAVRASLI